MNTEPLTAEQLQAAIEEFVKPYFPPVPLENCSGHRDHEERNERQRHKRNCIILGITEVVTFPEKYGLQKLSLPSKEPTQEQTDPTHEGILQGDLWSAEDRIKEQQEEIDRLKALLALQGEPIASPEVYTSTGEQTPMSEEGEDWRRYFKKPFKYQRQSIKDADGKIILCLPGWVMVRDIDWKEAASILDSIGNEIQNLFNK
jgi:hypothetical protein